MPTMPSFSHGGIGTGSMGQSHGSCLQQRESPSIGSSMGSYCMARPHGYDIGLGYGGRPSPCSPSQPYQMNGHQYSTNGSSSTGIYIFRNKNTAPQFISKSQKNRIKQKLIARQTINLSFLEFE